MSEKGVDELVEDFLSTCQTGKVPDIQTFAQQYPKYRKKLEELLPLVVKLEGYAEASKPTTVSAWEPFPELTDTDYQILRKIGSGGMGIVYEARQCSLNRNVALKVLAASCVADARQRAALEHEARVIAMLHHPNIVKVFSADMTSEQCYYAMELIRGKGVDATHFDDLRQIAAIGLQTAKALAYAHSCNVIHRDIKPSNLLLDAHGDVHVSDFGLAVLLENGITSPDAAHYGTLRYMAPERLEHGINTFAGDQYAFGVTLCEMVTHRPILTASSPKALTERILQGPLPPLKCAEPDLAAIINKCMAFRPEDRYPSMEHVVADLQRFLSHHVITAAPTSLFRRFRLWLRRKPAVAALSLLGLLLFVCLLAVLAVGYFRVNDARKLAEQNAAHAAATLADIFYHIEHQTPTTGGTELLSRLMPYYQAIAHQDKATTAQLVNAKNVIGTVAMRSGDYAIAETAFRDLAALQPSAYALNELAHALEQQGKTDLATDTYRQLLCDYPDSDEAIDALQALGDYTQAFELLHRRLQNDPQNPDLRFRYACLLGRQTPPTHLRRRPTIDARAIVILNELVEAYPDRPKYGIALMELACRQLRAKRRLSEQDRTELTLALTSSYRLLGRFPNTPGVLESVIELHRAYVAYLHRSGNMPTARQEIERLQGMLEILSYNPDAPASVKELLQSLKTEATPIPPKSAHPHPGPKRGKH